MRKVIIFYLIICSLPLAHAEPRESHLTLGQKYPYGLLGDGHGILSEDDLLISACQGEASPIASNNAAYPYWQCFRSQDASFECENSGYDHDERSVMAIMAITIQADHNSDEYLSPRAISMSACRRHQKNWARLIAKQRFFCAAGFSIKYQQPDKLGHKENTWIFDRVKTKRGCTSYFVGGCSLKYQLAHDCVFLNK